MDKIRNKYVEKNTNTPDNIREMVKEVYQVDVQAIKNLGELSKKILDANGVLELPYNVKITGNLETTGSTRTSSMDLGPDNCRWRFMGRNTGQAHEIGGLQIVRIKSDGSTVWSSGMILKTNLETGAAETSRINGNIESTGDVIARKALISTNADHHTGNLILGPNSHRWFVMARERSTNMRNHERGGLQFVKIATNKTIEQARTDNNAKLWNREGTVTFGTPDGLRVYSNVTASGYGQFGVAKIGSYQDNTTAQFSHKDKFNGNTYGILHTRYGGLIINSSEESRGIHFRFKNSADEQGKFQSGKEIFKINHRGDVTTPGSIKIEGLNLKNKNINIERRRRFKTHDGDTHYEILYA